MARDRTAESRASGGFLDVRRLDVVARFPDGSESDPFAYDIADRKALDAVVIAAHFAVARVRHVYLRSAARPPCALRTAPPFHDGILWELPAGLIEPGEDDATAAAREFGEELGFHLDPREFRELGPWTFPAPGMIGERHVFYAVEVEPGARRTPEGDGSVLERAAEILPLPLTEALAHCRDGGIRDAKTELALRRLGEILP